MKQYLKQTENKLKLYWLLNSKKTLIKQHTHIHCTLIILQRIFSGMFWLCELKPFVIHGINSDKQYNLTFHNMSLCKIQVYFKALMKYVSFYEETSNVCPLTIQ
jgi:hypothetical protein